MTKKHDVTFQHPELEENLPAITLVNDVCAGQAQVKKKTTEYLPKPNPTDTSTENTKRYEQYLARAVFYNATGRTLQGLVGAAFHRVPKLNVPDSLKYVANDVDGAGVSIYQQSQSTLKGVLKSARCALLADYPVVDGVASQADMRSGRIRATIIKLDATQVINWRVEKVGAEYKLTMAVISESVEEVTEDGFGLATIQQYRVLRITDGMYTQETWRKNDSDEWVKNWGPVAILDGGGKVWDEIPLTFVGASNNDASFDPSPLYDMAEINIAHYRNSADYEDSAYLCGQPQVWMSGLTQEWVGMLEKEGIYLGSRAPLMLPVDGEAGMMQAEPNTLCKEAMDQKEEQMVALGARLVQRGEAVKTATEAQGDQEVEHSVLSLAVSNVSEAYTKALAWCARFMNTSGEIEYTINQEFSVIALDAQMLTALVQAWQSGKLPEKDLWGQLKKYGLIDPEKTDEQIKEELETQGDGLDLDDGDS